MITCTFEDNGSAKLRHVTVNAIVVKDNKILLGKRGTYKEKPLLESGKWALLGGFLDRDETVIEAIKREIFEEAGWIVDNFTFLRINDNPNRPAEDRQNVDIIYICDAITQTGTINEEVRGFQWFDIDALPPKEEMAFDHLDSLIMYKKYKNGYLSIPITT